jgi:hypothetical protein
MREVSGNGTLRQRLYNLYSPGLTATFFRGFFYTGFRIGTFPLAKSLLNGEKECRSQYSFSLRVQAGAITGAIGCFLFSPLDVVRTRFHSNSKAYASTASALVTILRNEGRSGMYAGLSSSILRATFLSGSQLSLYETLKEFLRNKHAGKENVCIHLIASFFSGTIAQVIIMPFDVLKTQSMVRRLSLFESLKFILQGEGGIFSLYRGLVPALLRQGPCILIQMPIIEQFRFLLGLGYI